MHRGRARRRDDDDSKFRNLGLGNQIFRISSGRVLFLLVFVVGRWVRLRLWRAALARHVEEAVDGALARRVEQAVDGAPARRVEVREEPGVIRGPPVVVRVVSEPAAGQEVYVQSGAEESEYAGPVEAAF